MPLLLLFLPACRSEQSTLHPASDEARAVADLFWTMTIVGALIWALVFGIAIYAVAGKRRPRTEAFADRFVFFGGVVFPAIVLAVLLFFGLRLLPDWRENEAPDIRVTVTGEQFWWRISYQHEGRRIETANRLVLPVNRLIEFELRAEDVIHSFWIPPFGGKLDMIPGRVNLLRLKPDKEGRYRGACAELCGLSHALMALEVEVVSTDTFGNWLMDEAAPASPSAVANSSAFRLAGCSACHQIRGLIEEGGVGPDLTHFAARSTIGAGTLPLTRESLRDWLREPQRIKPGSRMPSYADLPEVELEKIVAFLMELR